MSNYFTIPIYTAPLHSGPRSVIVRVRIQQDEISEGGYTRTFTTNKYYRARNSLSATTVAVVLVLHLSSELEIKYIPILKKKNGLFCNYYAILPIVINFLRLMIINILIFFF